jgi:uncharacterized membrane protein (DUF4010 family)
MKYWKNKTIGLTTEIALILTYFIGVIAFYESYPYILTVSLGIILTLILLSLETMHKFARHLTEKEIKDAVIFAILAFIILPILPNEPIDPFGALNLHTVWFTIVLVLSVSFVAYVLMKVLGVRYGLMFTGLFGGVASSTAVTVSMSEKVRQNKRIIDYAIFAIVAASSTMFLRQVFIASVFNFDIIFSLLLPMLAISAFGYLLSFFVWKKAEKEKPEIKIDSPLALKPALKFAIIFSITLFLTNVLQQNFGITIVYPLALVAGLVDVDAITISLATSTLTGLPMHEAVIGIILAGLSNTFYKWFYLQCLGNKEMAIKVGKVFGLIILFGIFLLVLSSV